MLQFGKTQHLESREEMSLPKVFSSRSEACGNRLQAETAEEQDQQGYEYRSTYRTNGGTQNCYLDANGEYPKGMIPSRKEVTRLPDITSCAASRNSSRQAPRSLKLPRVATAKNFLVASSNAAENHLP